MNFIQVFSLFVSGNTDLSQAALIVLALIVVLVLFRFLLGIAIRLFALIFSLLLLAGLLWVVYHFLIQV
jgi:hypothetical protein